MADLFKKLVQLIVSPECFDVYFINFNFFDVPCFKATISKLLGYVIIAGSVTVKVPQILKLLNSKSAEGISLVGVMMELFAMTSNVSYNLVKGFPFSSWGDVLFMALQTAVVAALLLHYSRSPTHGAVFMGIYSVLAYIMASGFTPINVLWFFQALNVPVVVCGKMLQVMTNYRNGSTGQLSMATGFMLFFGTLSRIFTTLQETGDPLLVLTYLSAFSVNAIIAFQLIYYRNVKPKAPAVKRD